MDNLAQARAAGIAEPFGHRFASILIDRLVADPADDIAVLVARVSEEAHEITRSVVAPPRR